MFQVPGFSSPQISHSQLLSNVSDLPASRKTAGLPSHNSKFFMCPDCYMHFCELTQPRCYDSTSEYILSQWSISDVSLPEFVPRDDQRHLKYAFRARDATPEVAEDIFRKRGIRWSVMNELVGWMPAQSSSIEPMHCVMLSK
jgi:hypothetical protein